jgi:hypothetical protein
MILAPAAAHRDLNSKQLEAGLVVVGGGMAGACAAITAARQGLKVVLVQDRPVLGGNASSEVRLWLLGATVHMGSNNRWAREGGLINEIMMENLWRNPEGNPIVFDTILLEKAVAEKNLTLLLNAACFEVGKDPRNPDRISSVKAFCSQNSTLYEVRAPLFCDASGDGIVGFLAGAAFRMGAESREEFGEGFAPTGEFGGLLGHSIYFYSKNLGRPVQFTAPSYAMKQIEGKIPRYRDFNADSQGCRLWWIEYGGRLDTVHETENIKWELWKIVYGVWDYIKNSGKFPDAANLTLEWVGHIPGKRESRRFEGDYMLTQQDIVERRTHADAVAFGGWSIDLHPADGVFAEIAGSHHLHAKGPYQIPYRCYYSRNIENLFLAGRIISTSHVAFGSTRVMATCALSGQAVATAAALCQKYGELPRAMLRPDRMQELQRRLLRAGHDVPGVLAPDPEDLAATAEVTATSTLRLASVPADGPLIGHTEVGKPFSQMIPLPAGPLPELTFWADAESATLLEVELRTTSGPWHHTPDVSLGQQKIAVKAGAKQEIKLKWDTRLAQPGYVFVIFKYNPEVKFHGSNLRLTGLLRADFAHAEKLTKVGGEDYDVYRPRRRPEGHNLAFTASPAIDLYRPENIRNGWQRPNAQPNAWVAEPGAKEPTLQLRWSAPQTFRTVQLHLDGDFDHPMESVLWGHPERAVAFAVKRYQLLGDGGRVLADVDDAHLALQIHRFDAPVTTRELSVRILETWGAPAAVFEVRCYA